MPPRKHELDDEDEFEAVSPSIHKPKIDKPPKASTKLRAEKKTKIEKLKKEKGVDNKKTETSSTTVAAASIIGKDGKARVTALHGDDAMDLMLNYLREQNRPYSATEISANLHGKVTKSVADKLLREMSDMGKINSKSTKGNEKGSQWVFWALQDIKDYAGPEELKQMDHQICTLKENITELKLKFKSVQKTLDTVREKPTTMELSSNIEKLSQEIREKKEKLERYRNRNQEGYNGGENVVPTKDEVLKIEKDYRYWLAKRVARKRAFQGLEDLLLDSKTHDELWEEAGIEEDNYC